MRLAVHDNVVKENHASLVAVNQYPLSLIILASHAYAVSVRVRGHYDVSINALCQVKCHGECFTIFRVRTFNRWEVAVLNHLFGHAVYIFKSPELQ